MNAQACLVALLVIGCFAYATWTLAPRTLKRHAARALLRHPRWATVAALQRLARDSSACGCDGCDHAPAPQATATPREPGSAVVQWHPRRLRQPGTPR